ncbi:MAG: ChaN family lipoprotein, partial [Steroidobacteraceae bacterium]|nr:ChaN family lipoprotein [Steroidobacteraceae bacterium]
QLPIGDPARRERIARVVLDGITDTASGEVIDRGELARRLATARVLFIGEEHTNGECHRVQLHVIDALRAAGRTVVVALEMFPYSVIEPLRDWSAGKLSEQEFLQRANWYEHWSHHWGYYRDIFLYAREHGLRLVGINAPRAVVRQVRSRGFDSLDAATRERLPPTIDTSSKEHRRLVRSYFEADDPLHAKMSPEQLEGLYLAQVTWDAVMGWNAAQALSTPYDPREIVVVLIGAGHVAYGLGAERQLAPHFSGRIASLIPVTVRDDDGRPVAGVRASYANYIWGVPRTAQPTLPVLGVSLLGRVGPEPTTVIQIDKRSPAERAGLKVGDVLRSIDGAPIDGTPALQRRIAEYAWGDAERIAL